jgi:hypothetical protein
VFPEGSLILYYATAILWIFCYKCVLAAQKNERHYVLDISRGQDNGVRVDDEVQAAVAIVVCSLYSLGP